MDDSEQYPVYRTGDASARGVRVQLEYQATPNLALAVSGLPILRTLVVHNETGSVVSRLSVEGSFAFGQTESASFTVDVVGPHAPSATIDIPLTSVVRQATVAAFQQSVEAASGTIRLRVVAGTVASKGDGPIAVELELPVHVLPGNEFLNWPELHAALAAFVRPNSRSMTPILRAASDLLMDKTKSGALEGYQNGPARAQRIAGALYESLRGKQVTYTNPPASFEFTGQKVRTVDQVLADRFGTCIDLAVLYAAALEAAGLYPVLFLAAGHAFAGYYADDQLGDQTVLHDPNIIATLVDAGAIVPVELTGISPGLKVPFRAAVQSAREYSRASFDMMRSLAMERPAEVSAEQMAAAPDERPFVARSSLKNLTPEEDAEEIRGTLDLADPTPARIKNWKRDLLDLSLRNPLLNLPHSGKTLDLLVPGGLLARIDDAVHAGKRITVQAMDAIDEVARQRGIRAASELAPHMVTRQFEVDHAVFGVVDSAVFTRKLRTLQRDALTLEQETGSNYLYLAMGSLVHSKPSGGEARAPLFLLPVRLRGNPVLGTTSKRSRTSSRRPTSAWSSGFERRRGSGSPRSRTPRPTTTGSQSPLFSPSCAGSSWT